MLYMCPVMCPVEFHGITISAFIRKERVIIFHVGKVSHSIVVAWFITHVINYNSNVNSIISGCMVLKLTQTGHYLHYCIASVHNRGADQFTRH